MLKILLLLVLCAFLLAPVAAQDAVLPDSLQPITIDNVTALERLAQLGRGQLLDAFLSENGATLTVISARGISRYDASFLTDTPVEFVPFEGDPLQGFYASFYDPNVTYSADGRAVTIAQPWREQTLGGTFDLVTGERLNADELVATGPAVSVVSGAVRLFDPGTGTILHLLEFGDGRIEDAVLSPDASLVAVAGLLRGEPGAGLQLWDAATGQKLTETTFERPQLGAIRFSADGTRITMQGDVTSIYSVPDLSLLDSQPYPFYTLSPDGQTAAYLNEDSTLTLENRATGEIRTTSLENIPVPAVHKLFFSPDGSMLYLLKLANAGAVFVVDVETGGVVDGVGGFATPVNDLAFDLDGSNWITAEYDSYPQPYARLNRGNVLRFYEFPAAEVSVFRVWDVPGEVALSAQGVLAYTIPNTIRLNSDGRGPERTDELFPFYILHLEFSPDGALLAADVGDRLLVLDGESLDLVAEIAHPGGAPFWGDGLLWRGTTLIYAEDSAVVLWDSETQREVARFDQGQTVRGLAFNAQTGTLALNVGTPDAQELRLWNVQADELTPMTAFPLLSFRDGLAFSPDGSLLAAAVSVSGDVTGPGMVMYDVTSGEIVFEVRDCGLPIDFSPDGRLFVCFSPIFDPIVYGVE